MQNSISAKLYNTNTIQYKTCNAPYVTRMLFVGAVQNSSKIRIFHHGTISGVEGQFAQGNMIQRVENITFGSTNKAVDDAEITVL